MKIKQILAAAVMALTLATSAAAQRGGFYVSYGSYYRGWNWDVYAWIMPCYWSYAQWDDGSYSYTDTCGGSMMYVAF